jgi:hypothetical protein
MQDVVVLSVVAPLRRSRNGFPQIESFPLLNVLVSIGNRTKRNGIVLITKNKLFKT